MRSRTGIMLAKPYEKRHLMNMKKIALQPKINGLRCVVVKTEDTCIMYSSTRKQIVSLPHIVRAYKKYPNGIYDGELYCEDMLLQDIRSIVMRNNAHPDHEKIKHFLFDLIPPEIAIRRDTFSERQEKLLNTWAGILDEAVQYVQTYFTWLDFADYIRKYLDLFLSYKYEGIIIRDALKPYTFGKTEHMLKIKPQHFDIYKVVGTIQEEDKNGFKKPFIGALIVEDKDKNIFKVGSGLDYTLKDKLYRTPLTGNEYVIIKYPEVTKAGIPFQPIFVSLLDINNKEDFQRILLDYKHDDIDL